MTESTLICTLGGQPQIVTFALDCLLAKSELVREVFVVHLSPSDGRVNHSLTRLQAKFEGDEYRGRLCRFRPAPVRRGSRVLTSIRTEAEAELARQTVFALITDLKQAERTLHLCIAGGPRMLGLMALSAAMLLCGHEDKVWHIHTEPDFLAQAENGALMHDESGEQVRLVQVPVVPWGAYLPPFSGIARSADEMLKVQTNWLDQDGRKRCREVWARLTPRTQEVLRAFAEGLDRQQVAQQLHLSMGTVSDYTTQIYGECRNAWGLDQDARLTFHFLREHFRQFITEV